MYISIFLVFYVSKIGSMSCLYEYNNNTPYLKFIVVVLLKNSAGLGSIVAWVEVGKD